MTLQLSLSMTQDHRIVHDHFGMRRDHLSNPVQFIEARIWDLTFYRLISRFSPHFFWEREDRFEANREASSIVITGEIVKSSDR